MKHSGRLELALSVALLSILAIVYCAWPIWRMTFPLAIDRNEPWNAWHADAVLKGLPLYPDPQGLVANNYPPLSFYLVSALSSGSFDAIYVGRALSVIAVVVICVAVAACIRLLGGSWFSSVVGALWLLATLARFYDVYFGMNDPQLPALAIMVSALAWVLRCVKQSSAVEPAIALMVLAGFYKYNLVATPIAALLWIAIKDWHRGLRTAIFGTFLVGAGLTLCVAIYGTVFIQQLFFPREHSIWMAIVSLRGLHRIALAMIIWALWIWYDRNSEAAKFTLLYVAAALVACFLQKLGAGVESGDFELVAAIAIGVGMAISQLSMIPLAHRWGSDRSRAMIITLLAFRLVLSTHMEPYLVLTSSKFRTVLNKYSVVTAAEINRIRNIPGHVHCSVMTVCYWAGKRFVYDSFFVHEKIITHRLADKDVATKINSAGIKFITIDPRVTVGCAVDSNQC